MARSRMVPMATGTAPRSRKSALFGPLLLGLWRIRRMWAMLLVAQLGMIVAVLLVCTVPVFGRVAEGAGFQAQLAAHPDVATFLAHIGTNQPTQRLVDTYNQRVASIRNGVLRPFHLGQSRLVLSTGALALNPTSAHGQNVSTPTSIMLGGEQAQTLAGDLRVVQGRLPHAARDALEVVVGVTAAASLHLTPGTILPLGAVSQSAAQAPIVRVVGIVSLDTTTFAYPLGAQTTSEPSGLTTSSWAVTSNEAITAYTYNWSPVVQVASGDSGSRATWNITWTASMDLSRLSAQDLSALLDGNPQRFNNQLIQLMSERTASSDPDQGATPSSAFAISSLFEVLQDYQRRLIGAQILAGLLLADVLGVVLIFLTQIATMLVELQEPLIALLRSRGASQGQIFGTFAVQTLLLGLVGLLIGAALALPVARFVSSALLPTSERSTLGILNGSLFSISTGAAIAAVVTSLMLVLAMLRAVSRSNALNMLTLRQESVRPARKPLWQRLYLDVAAALLACMAYGTYALTYALAAQASTTGATSELQLVLTPLAITAPPFLLIAGMLLFLRFFPLLLRLVERLVTPRGGVAPMLALAQLARSAHKTARIVLPLALATCFLLFTLATHATIEQQISDMAAFQTGADFSGGLPSTTDLSFASRYAQVPGVLSVALGYRGATVTAHCNTFTFGCDYSSRQVIEIEAVDTERFAQAAIWPSQDAAQPLTLLMNQLADRRTSASASNIVPVILDRNAAATLGVTHGASFSLPAPAQAIASMPDMRFSVVAVAPYLPSVYSIYGGGMLADYATFAAVYRQLTGGAAPDAVAPNFIWLRTADDASSLTSVRAAITAGPLALSAPEESTLVPIQTSVSDRRAIAASLHGDPLRLTVSGILDLGAGAVLLLVLCGTLITSGVGAREREMALWLLRALGTKPRQVRAVIGWEQGVVYMTALTVGALLGAALTEVMLPPLAVMIFTNAFGGPIEDGIPPVRMVWPWPTLAIMFGALALICILAALLATHVVAPSSLSRTLRLSEEGVKQ